MLILIFFWKKYRFILIALILGLLPFIDNFTNIGGLIAGIINTINMMNWIFTKIYIYCLKKINQ